MCHAPARVELSILTRVGPLILAQLPTRPPDHSPTPDGPFPCVSFIMEIPADGERAKHPIRGGATQGTRPQCTSNLGVTCTRPKDGRSQSYLGPTLTVR